MYVTTSRCHTAGGKGDIPLPPIICIQKIALSLSLSSTSLRDLLQDKLIVPDVHIKYRIAGNFRGVKYSFFSWQADLDKNFTPRKHYRNAPNTVHVVKQTKILLTKLTAVQVQRNFYPTKITRYTVLQKNIGQHMACCPTNPILTPIHLESDPHFKYKTRKGLLFA